MGTRAWSSIGFFQDGDLPVMPEEDAPAKFVVEAFKTAWPPSSWRRPGCVSEPPNCLREKIWTHPPYYLSDVANHVGATNNERVINFYKRRDL